MSADKKISVAMKKIAKHLDEYLEEIAGERMAFSLVVFNVEPNSRMSYVSNCKREEAHAALKSLVMGWEKGMPDIPAHELDG